MTASRLLRMPPERRRRLVDVAAAEFAAAGYEDASLNRIIERCGMSKSSFYYVLSSKAELFDFVIGELVDSVAAHIAVPRPEQFRTDAFWERLEKLFAELVDVSRQHQEFLTLGRMFYSAAPAAAKAVVNDTLTAVHTWVADVLQVGRRFQAVRDDLPEELQIALVFRVLQVFDEWTVAHYEQIAQTEELGRLADAQFATIRRMLERRPTETRRRASAG
ncbi:TetR/AcrR family transcriptional regulator [Mycolicibacterium pulveris]|uniref:TetR/AcrR family transcriptional regulator n=1 Tax=Mycolicibacterium pulveris TaxID=36813 RepID=UPI003CFBC2CA